MSTEHHPADQPELLSTAVTFDTTERLMVASAQAVLARISTIASQDQDVVDLAVTHLYTDATDAIGQGLENIQWYREIKTTSSPTQPIDSAPQFSFSASLLSKSPLPHLPRPRLPELPQWLRRRRFTLWQSESYFRPTENLTEDQRVQRLKLDLITFLHEYVGFQTKKMYPYTQFGILDGYDVPVSTICRNHQNHLEKLGLETTRAQLETYVAEALEAWFDQDQLPVGSKLLSMSPPGTLAEGYPGKKAKNYAFINVYHKLADDEFQLVQYLSYDQEQELEALIGLIQKDHPSQLFRPHPLPVEPTRLDHHLITQLLTFGPDLTFDQFENLVFRNEKTWVKPLSHFPDLTNQETAFSTQIQAVLDLCSQEFRRLYQTEPAPIAAAQFDLLVDTVRKKFLVWVQDHAQNYHPGETITPTALNLDEIRDYWLKRVAKTFKPDSLTSDDKHALRAYDVSVRLNPLLPLGRLASVAHCVTMTPPSLVFKAGSLSFKMQMLEGAVGLSFEHRRPRFTDYQPLTLVDPETGVQQTWYVLRQYFKDYEHTCYLKDGIAYGPCHVALADDAFVLSEADYLQLKQENALAELETTVTELATTTTPDYQAQFVVVMREIKHRILRPSISPTQLLTNDFFDPRKLLRLNDELFQLTTQLRHETQPLAALEAFLWKLVAEENTTELTELLGESLPLLSLSTTPAQPTDSTPPAATPKQSFASPHLRQSRYN